MPTSEVVQSAGRMKAGCEMDERKGRMERVVSEQMSGEKTVFECAAMTELGDQLALQSARRGQSPESIEICFILGISD